MARDFFDELSDTITRTTKDLSKKAGQLYETQKIRSKIASEEQMIEKLKADIGNVIYERYKDGADTEEGLKGFCEEIQQRMQIIARYRDAAANLKGQKICPFCCKGKILMHGFFPPGLPVYEGNRKSLRSVLCCTVLLTAVRHGKWYL